ncbi:MAG: hypothetical protein DSY42_01125 [Aquifex sp.]|nr:MAG: hypothetical protein DSY42_01125 [Aquifex sp.]
MAQEEGLRFRLPEEELKIIELKKQLEEEKLKNTLKELRYRGKVLELELKLQKLLKEANLIKAKNYKKQQWFKGYYVTVPPGVEIKGIVGKTVVVAKGIAVSEGSRIEGWKIVKVTPTKIVVENQGIRRQITLVTSLKRPKSLEEISMENLSTTQISVQPQQEIPLSSEELAKLLRGEVK